jgi:Icc protein
LINRRQFLASAGSVLMAMATGCARTPLLRGAASANLGAGVALAPEPEPLPPPDPVAARPFRVALLSDPHLQAQGAYLSETINPKLSQAVADFRRMTPDLWVTNGDIADHGLPSEYDVFKQIMGRVTRPDRLLTTTGNHEFYDLHTTDDVAVSRFKQAFGVAQPYSSKVYGNVHFVMLADEQWKSAPYNPDWCWITPSQLRWFERVLAEYRNKLTVVFMHQPLNETVLGSVGPNNFAGANVAPELYEILRQNTQIKLWFSGHTHRRLDLPDQVVRKAHTTFVALGSTIYMLAPQAGGQLLRQPDASQSRMLDIYPDKVVIGTRDHAARTWLQDLTVTVQRT